MIVLNLSLRIASWGGIGGYSGTPSDYTTFFWDELLYRVHMLLAPVNISIFPPDIAQGVGAASTLLLLLGLIGHGHTQRPLLLLAGTWILLALIPVLSLEVTASNLANNRLLYLAVAGYCLAVAALLHAALLSCTGGRRRLVASFVGLLVLVSTFACWAHIAPWHIATAQAEEVESALLRLIPSQPRPKGMIWYVENPPTNYNGAYVVGLALGQTRHFTAGDIPAVQSVASGTDVPIANEYRDAFALRFRFNEDAKRFYVDYATGITWPNAASTDQEVGKHHKFYDFTKCDPDILRSWQPVEAEVACDTGKGLLVIPRTPDAQLIGHKLSLEPSSDDGSFVRIRVAATYPANETNLVTNQWFWKESISGWSEDRSRSMATKQDGKSHIYWTFIPSTEIGEILTGLRFDPANDMIPTTIQWIAIDEVR